MQHLVDRFCSDGKQYLLARGDNGPLGRNLASMTEVDNVWDWVYFWKQAFGKIRFPKVDVIVLV